MPDARCQMGSEDVEVISSFRLYHTTKKLKTNNQQLKKPATKPYL
jgi:hypothetical protein